MKSGVRKRMSEKSMRLYRVAWIIFSTVVAVAVAVSTVFIQRNRISDDADRAIAMIKDVCQRYDDYQLGARVDRLQALVNKANILSIYTENVDLTKDEVLERYARNQYLSGILVLDDSLRVVGAKDISGGNVDELVSILQEAQCARDILACPQKVRASSIVADGRDVNYAMVARRGVSGVIVCYADVQREADAKYDLTLNTLLIPEMLSTDVTFVITDGETVLSTNEKKLMDKRVEDCPVTNVAQRAQRICEDELYVLHSGQSTWLGRYDVYREYYIYCFYPESEIWLSCAGWTVGTAGVCMFLTLVAALGFQRRKRIEMQRIEKEYNLRARWPAFTPPTCSFIRSRIDGSRLRRRRSCGR